MVSKERLKELIDKKATIYYVSTLVGKRELAEHKYNDKKSIYKYLKSGEYTVDDIYDNCWFDNKEDAEFALKYKNIERTEILDLPNWEEFIEMEEVCFFQKNHKQTILRVLGTKYLVVETNFERYYTGDLTKENYMLACRKCRELFLGEKI